jgi:hypothetical protein
MHCFPVVNIPRVSQGDASSLLPTMCLSVNLPNMQLRALTSQGSLHYACIPNGYLNVASRRTIGLTKSCFSTLTHPAKYHMTASPYLSDRPGRVLSQSYLSASSRRALSNSPLASAPHTTSSTEKMTIKVGDTIPETSFTHVPWGPELDDAVCPFQFPLIPLRTSQYTSVSCRANIHHSLLAVSPPNFPPPPGKARKSSSSLYPEPSPPHAMPITSRDM